MRGAAATIIEVMPGQHADVGRDLPARVDQRLELAEHLAAADLHRADLGDRAVLRRPAGGLEVDDDERDVRQRRAEFLDRHLRGSGRAAVEKGTGRTVGRGNDTPVMPRRGRRPPGRVQTVARAGDEGASPGGSALIRTPSGPTGRCRGRPERRGGPMLPRSRWRTRGAASLVAVAVAALVLCRRRSGLPPIPATSPAAPPGCSTAGRWTSCRSARPRCRPGCRRSRARSPRPATR